MIYISEVFESIEKEISEAHALFFADDIEIVISRSSVKQICDRLQKAAKTVEKWDWAHVIQFDTVKMKAVLFTQKQDCRRRELIQKAHIQIEDHRVSFNQETIRWLEIWLNTELIFKAHFQKHLQKVKKTETRIRALSQREDLASDLVLRIQITAV